MPNTDFPKKFFLSRFEQMTPWQFFDTLIYALLVQKAFQNTAIKYNGTFRRLKK